MKKLLISAGTLTCLSLSLCQPVNANPLKDSSPTKYFSIETGSGINYGPFYSIRMGFRLGKENPWGFHAMYNEETNFSSNFQTYSIGTRYYTNPTGSVQSFLKFDYAHAQPKGAASYHNYQSYVHLLIGGVGVDWMINDGFAITTGLDGVTQTDFSSFHFRPEFSLKWLF